ncbi:MAG: soluble lytic murein transglycosylase [Flavobacteriales bacterium]|jgi:soluble lytic murein transglycosylase
MNDLAKFMKCFLALCTLCSFVYPVNLAAEDIIPLAIRDAGSTSSALSISEQRKTYVQARAALKSDNTADYTSLRGQLDEYPLAIYLDYVQITKNLKALKIKSIDDFLRDNPNTYLAARLRQQLLLTLYQQQRWQDFLFYANQTPTNTKDLCRFLYAKYKAGQMDALADVADIWTKPKSQPKACDPIFTVWQSSDYFKAAHAWRRFIDSMHANKRSLARYSASLLPSDYDHYIAAIHALDSRPHKIRNYKNYSTHSLEMQDIIVFGVSKYARYDPQKTLALWESYEAKQIFTIEGITRAKLAIVKRLLKKGHIDDTMSLVQRSPSLRQAKVVEQLARFALKEQNWTNFEFAVNLLPPSFQEKDRWKYWRARALEETNEHYNIELAKTAFQALSKNRSFYGFLASDRLGESYSLKQQTAKIPESTLTTIASIPAIVRAKELWHTNHLSEAYAEWRFGLQGLSSRELVAAAVLADRWAWHDRAIHATIKGKLWNYLNIRFPLAFKSFIETAAAKTKMAPAFIYAIARQESAMDETAKSPVGALGLMQLMPATAKQVAKQQGLKHNKKALTTAEYNIFLGSHYLDGLLDRYDGNRILASAAYNAGPSHVRRWLNDKHDGVPFDIWIETIPFKETRGYVKNVLTYSVIYSYRMGKPELLITESEANRKL